MDRESASTVFMRKKPLDFLLEAASALNTSIKDMENLDAFKQEVARAPSSARLVNLKFRGGDSYINHIIHLSVWVA